MTRQFAYFVLQFAVLSCLMLQPALAHEDIEITVDNGQLIADPRVGEGEFGEGANPPNVADEPGFDVEDGDFNPGDDLSFNVLPIDFGSPSEDVRHLWFWDGVGSVSFGPTSDTLTIEHPVSMQSVVLNSNPGAGTLPGFLIGVADPAGGIHQHLDFILGTNPPADGVYLFSLEMTSTAYNPSDPVYFVLASNVPEAVHEAAVDYVVNYFNIPEPATGWFAGVVGLFLAGVRRRRWN